MFANRLKELRRVNGISQAALSNVLGLSQQAVGKWETSRCTPDPKTLTELANYFNVSTDYLLGNDVENNFSNVNNYNSRKEHPIQVIGTVRAGYNALAFEEDYGVEYANVKDPENYFYLIVKGDSMEPKISEGDLALVRRQNTLENGELGVIICADESGTLKKFIKRGNAVILQPFNPDYSAQIIMGEDINDIKIVGKVVETKTKW